MVVLAATVAAAAFAVSSDSAYALVAGKLDLAPSSTIGTAAPDVGLIVEAPQKMLPPLARTIANAGGRASFAFSAAPSPFAQRFLQHRGDTLIPSLASAGFLGWVTTADHLQDAEASIRAVRVAYCLAPNSGLTAGQYLLARAAGLRVIAGSVNLRARSVVPAAIGRGAIVVLRLLPGNAGSRLLLQLLAQLRRQGLRAVPIT
jgi:hypothetical protein